MSEARVPLREGVAVPWVVGSDVAAAPLSLNSLRSMVRPPSWQVS